MPYGWPSWRATGMVATAKPQRGQGIRILASRKPGWQIAAMVSAGSRRRVDFWQREMTSSARAELPDFRNVIEAARAGDKVELHVRRLPH